MLRRCSCEIRKIVSSAVLTKQHSCKLKKEFVRIQASPHQAFHTTSHRGLSKNSEKNDLSRFLIEIGTDPKEARYWLKIFSSSAEAKETFMVINVDDEVMQNKAQLETFASTVSFLYRNNMFPLIVYGTNSKDSSFDKTTKDVCIWNAMELSNLLEQHGVYTRVLYPGCGVVLGETERAGLPECAEQELHVDPTILRSDFSSSHLPILLSYGETAQGKMFSVDAWTLTEHVACLLQPLKVMLVNAQGGFLDEHGKVIANINLPSDLAKVRREPWKTPEKIEMMKKVNNLLEKLPLESSAVITSADTMLRELFSHRGSGTFFRHTEAVHSYMSLDNIDLDKLRKLLQRSFQKTLSDTYFDDILPYIHAIYLSETYSGVAIILRGGEGMEHVPYLCKFAVTEQAQGQGIGELLWDEVRRAEPCLYWRSQNLNPINTWYFKKCEGSWNNPSWTVFWYGIKDPSVSYLLIADAMRRVDTFERLQVPDESPVRVKQDVGVESKGT